MNNQFFICEDINIFGYLGAYILYSNIEEIW